MRTKTSARIKAGLISLLGPAAVVGAVAVSIALGGCATFGGHQTAPAYQEVDGWECKGEEHTVVLPSGMPTEWVTTDPDTTQWIKPMLIAMGAYILDEANVIGIFVEHATADCPGWIGLVWAVQESDAVATYCYRFDDDGLPYEVTEEEFDAFIFNWQGPEPSEDA